MFITPIGLLEQTGFHQRIESKIKNRRCLKKILRFFSTEIETLKLFYSLKEDNLCHNELSSPCYLNL